MNDQRRREGKQIENHRHILHVFVCAREMERSMDP